MVVFQFYFSIYKIKRVQCSSGEDHFVERQSNHSRDRIIQSTGRAVSYLFRYITIIILGNAQHFFFIL